MWIKIQCFSVGKGIGKCRNVADDMAVILSRPECVNCYFQAFYFPEHVGVPLMGGAESPTHLLIETHYDNPNLQAGNKWITIGSGNGLVLNRQQAITRTSDELHSYSLMFALLFVACSNLFCGNWGMPLSVINNTKLRHWKRKAAIMPSVVSGGITAISSVTSDDKVQSRQVPGTDSIWRCKLISIGITIVEIRRSYDCLISTIVKPILILIWQYLYIEPL